MGAQTAIERRLVGNRAGAVEGAEVGIRHLVSSLQGASLPSPIRPSIWSLSATESIALTLCNVAIYFHSRGIFRLFVAQQGQRTLAERRQGAGQAESEGERHGAQRNRHRDGGQEDPVEPHQTTH